MNETEAVVSRTHSWTPPGAVDLGAVSGRDGLGQLQAYEAGEVPAPPIMSTLAMTLSTAGRGTVNVEMKVEEFHYNPLGTVHGGVISTLLDTAAGCAVHSTLAEGEAYTSLDLNVSFLRPVTLESGLLRAVGRVISRGRRTALARAELVDERERLVAHATSTCMIFS